ncbi:uncharacterized protein LOC124266690 isoform X2 [Haliotis rubra]|uniref:uncharacterized protein LOC124266690 isoform X2 n=1 Tax=Haliotis rubra TaxID=36100 RepID=UPI001EE5FA08|nr:uncharacterized protein LOC124266690 isoform X2 [Haliotis rubra]
MEVCDDGGTDGTAGDVTYQQKCMARCPPKKAYYTLTVWTGKERYSGSKADVVLTIGGSCGNVQIEMKNGRDIRLTRGRRSTFKFVADSVCSVEFIGLAFSASCHLDGWLVSYVVVEYEEMTTGDSDRLKLEPNYWLTVNVEHEQTTGILCSFVTPIGFMFTPYSDGGTYCTSSQTCEH